MKGLWNSTSINLVTLSFIFFFVCYFEDVFAAPPTTRHLCRPEQRDALLAFKNEFQIGRLSRCYSYGHPKTESWTNNSDCCSWEGITCNAESGEVVELDLRCSFLHGRFHANSSLQNLPFLTTLDLSYNNLTGQIPDSIGNLSHLINLRLAGNHFSGRIPSSIGNLTQLTSLDLSQNQLSGQLPSSVGNLTQLTSLQLSNNQLSGQIPYYIGNLPHLISLDLSRNKFSGRIPSSIGNLSVARFLLISLHYD
ncbi:PREDICTED: receptor-like protein 12 [Camelina sativa]|uniref:Receptor-like protein 12 n=1 Tax=Camelina sativa TaxID=90675 RepID=A0ABM0XJ41_CAMSA|nr:PREDICTED: receptor-like protein 12 [Camelina sativa]